MAQILNSKPVIDKYRETLKQRSENFFKASGQRPCLKVVLVGEDPASKVYTGHKKRFCDSISADCEIIALPKSTEEQEFLSKVDELSNHQGVHGIIIQLPLPQHLAHLDVSQLIPAHKDVDGFHPLNIDAIIRGRESKQFLPCCTPRGVITLLDEYQIELASKHVLIIGRSMIVGKPLSLMFLNRHATVTMAHSRTPNIHELAQMSDIIVSAVGRPKFLGSSILNSKKEQILVDVGINRDSNGSLCGDFDYDDLVEHVTAITPVPGGVGPMTVMTLAQNLLQAAENTLNTSL